MKVLRNPDMLIASAKSRLMSNAKWRKFVGSVENCGVEIVESHWKWVGDDRVQIHRRFPRVSDLNEVGFADGRYYPAEFKYIESVLFPRFRATAGPDSRRPLPQVAQPLHIIESALASCGRLPVFESENGLSIVAYEF